MDRLQDMLSVYKKSFKNTLNAIKKNPILLVLPIAYSMLRYGVGQIVTVIPSGGQFLWGFIYALLLALILSSYYYQLNSAVFYNRVNFRGFKKSFFYYASSIYYVFFITMIIDIVLYRFFNLPTQLSMVVQIAIFLGLNAMPETIYVKELGYQESFAYNFRYLKENWYLFLIPTIIYLAIGYYGLGMIELDIMELHYGANFFWIFFDAIKYVLFQVITAIFIVFRGFLFKGTMDSSLRKRQYMGLF